MATATGNLVRKQILVSPSQVKKLVRLASAQGKSQAEIVRLAIDAFNPNKSNSSDESELMDLVSERLKEAIESTEIASSAISNTLDKLSTHSSGNQQ